MTPWTSPTALIAEDEPLLAEALQAELARAWPELRVLERVGDGLAAVQRALSLRPDVLFFDIRMPGQSGLEAAVQLADEWPADRPFPALVFVTAYDQYAVQAFEAQAADYLLKPVQPQRLRRTVQQLRQRLAPVQPIPAAPGTGPDLAFDRTLQQLRALLAASETPQPPPAPAPPLAYIQAGLGSTIRLVPVSEVCFLEAADKYLRVFTTDQEHLIRTPLKDLLPQLDPAVFWQVHRGTVVHAGCIDTVWRDDSGRLSLSLRGRPERLAVSRLYAHRFRAM
ncbi:MAG: response regulator transcription factor [Rhodoferax sp.]|nr:response regulator transcription factor [Rhodoferax sp.]